MISIQEKSPAVHSKDPIERSKRQMIKINVIIGL
jgi:hypothetical protein